MRDTDKSYFATLSDNDDEDDVSNSDFDEEIHALMGCLSQSSVK